MDTVSFLRTVPLFAELEPEHLEEIARLAVPFAFDAGAFLFHHGDAGDALYLLASGKVQVTGRLLGENMVALSEVGPGALLGEMAVIDGRPRSASAQCLEPASGIGIRRSHFAMLRAELHPAALRLMRNLALELARRQAEFNVELAAVPPPSASDAIGRSLPPASLSKPRALEPAALDRRALKSIPLFAGFGDAKLEELLAATRAWALPRGHVLTEKDQPGSSCFLTVRGAVRISLLLGGFCETLAILGPGCILGHMMLLDAGTRSATCVVRENAIVLELERTTFEAWCERRNPLAFDLLEIVNLALCDGLRDSGRLMARFAAEGRVRRRVLSSAPPSPNPLV